ncbi:TetR family transcriptional regulator [Nocardia camponoti]|uniref:TetR family transcriptional regulator n=1 Tax=Nocardia camponoti TaxID=1616106 RepID=A0A917V4B4_9NOCA|nr:TetR family transcriptional regulator [Nocardia camponoti]
MAGARKVIMERGVAKATARDIAAAAGVSLAAIGYHFGSKERLVTEALADALGNAIGDAMESLIRDGAGEQPLTSFARMWDAMPTVFADNREAMLASLENVVRIVRSPEARAQLGDQLPEVYTDLAAHLREAHPELDAVQADSIARLMFSLVQGLSLMWLLNPAAMPSGDQLAVAVRALAGS